MRNRMNLVDLVNHVSDRAFEWLLFDRINKIYRIELITTKKKKNTNQTRKVFPRQMNAGRLLDKNIERLHNS